MEPPLSSVDPITFEILSHRLHQIAKEMGTTLERVGGTANTTQMHDYMASLYRANGEVLAAGESMGWHVACAGFAVKRILERFEREEGIGAGDIFLINDPYLTAIHQSDVYMVSPIHFGGKLVGWSATFVHVMDIGAMSPGGNSPGATEICQEGVRVPGVKLVERGKLRRDVFDMIVGMTRQPVMVGLDLKCEMAANNVARMRMEEMYGQYGAELVDGVSQEMIRYSESILRRRVRELRDGEWGDSAVIEGSEKWRVELRLRKVGDRLVFDFTGTDKQAKTGINLPYHATFGACYEVVLGTLGYDIPKNHGVMRPMEVIAPEGTIVNVKPPAPVSMNTTSGGQTVKFLVKSVLMQILATSDKWRGEVMAHSVGQRLARHAGINQYGRYYASGFALGAFAGSGATTCGDGTDSSHGGHLSCPNVEWSELNFPLLHLFRRHIRDGAGAGKFRGGVGGETAVMVHDAPEGKIKVVAYGVAGLANSGRGIFGGYPGAPSVIILREEAKAVRLLSRGRWPGDLDKAGGRARLLPYCDFDLREGDILYMRQSSGGGYGDPLERDAGMVSRDVANGVVSKEVARTIYGVAVKRQGELDPAATEKLRGEMRKRRLKGSVSGKGRGGNGTSFPPCEVVEEWESAVRCVRCKEKLGKLGEEWKEGCRMKELMPTEAGPLMKALVGHFILQQFYCPSCGALLESSLREKDKGRRPEKRAGKTGARRAAPRSVDKKGR